MLFIQNRGFELFFRYLFINDYAIYQFRKKTPCLFIIIIKSAIVYC
jgi:hypothetical protein